MRLNKRDIKSGLIFYQVKGDDKQTVSPNLNVSGTEECFILVKPIRIKPDGKPEVLTFLIDTQKGNLNFTNSSEYADDDDDQYILMGEQVWLVYNTKDPSHKFRKYIRYLIGESFEKYLDRQELINKKRSLKGLPDKDSIAYNDYKSKKGSVLKVFKNDDFKNNF